MATELIGYVRRRMIFEVTITDVDGNIVPLVAGDVVRVKIGHPPAVPILDLESTGPTANGSTVTFSNPATVVIDADDMATLDVGNWTIEAALYQAAQGETLHAVDGTLTVLATMAGDISGT